MITQPEIIQISNLPTPKGHKEDAWFTADEVIGAYRAGQKSYKKSETDKAIRNMEYAKIYTEFLHHALKKVAKVSCRRIRLRHDNVNSFSALIEISEKSFFNFEKYKIIDLVASICESEILPKYKINFNYSLMPSNKNVNHEMIIADGYNIVFEHGK